MKPASFQVHTIIKCEAEFTHCNLAFWHFKANFRFQLANDSLKKILQRFSKLENSSSLGHYTWASLLLSCYSKIECIMKGKQKGYWTSSTLKWRPGSLTDPLLNLWGSFVVPYGLTRLSAVTQFVKVTINALTPFAVTNRPGSKLRRFSLHKQLPHQINLSTFAYVYVFKIFLYVYHTHKYRD